MPNQNPTDIRCISCGSESPRAVGPIPMGYEFGGRKLDKPIDGGFLYRCDSCRVSFRWPRLPKKRLDELYQLAELDHWTKIPEDRPDWRIGRAAALRHASTGSVLDIGCFDGGFLSHLGSAWERFGVEINVNAAQIARGRGIDIIAYDFEEMRESSSRFDIVVAFDVIEHMSDPRAFLERMVSMVKDGGLLIVGTGNTEARSWRLMGSRYWYCMIPEHISFVGAEWCQKAATDLGLKLESIVSFSHAENRTLALRSAETIKNLAYRIAPGLFGWLRKRGLGGVDISIAEDLRNVPPIWISAEDQIVAVFRNA